MKSEKPLPALTALAVRGFKSFAEERRVEIKPLTLLAGANSSGKSSLMQPLLLMKQTLEAPFDPGALRPDGPHVQFTAGEQLLTRGTARKGTGFWIQIEVETGEELGVEFRLNADGLFDVARSSSRDDSFEFDLKLGARGESAASIPGLGGWLNAWAPGERAPWEVVRRRCFLGLEVRVGARSELAVYVPGSEVQLALVTLLHVPGLRGNPERSYRIVPATDRFAGLFHSYTASVITVWQREKDPRLALLSKALQDLGLTSSIEARSVDATQAELLVDRQAARTARGVRDLVSLADVGFGVSQVLPVLVALLVARPGQLVYLEQPEIHLHPRAQQALAGILADAAKRGVRVVAETHSDILLLAVQALVAGGELSPDLVKLHWFSRNAKGITEVTSADLDAFGAYGDWPEDFGAVDAEVQNRYLDAVEARARGGRKRGKAK